MSSYVFSIVSITEHFVGHLCNKQSQVGGVLWNFRQFHVYVPNLEIEHRFQSSNWPILQ